MIEKPKHQRPSNMIKTPRRNHNSVVGHRDSMCEALRLVPTRHKAPVTVLPLKGECFSSQVRKTTAGPLVPSSNTETEAIVTKIYKQTAVEETAQREEHFLYKHKDLNLNPQHPCPTVLWNHFSESIQ